MSLCDRCFDPGSCCKRMFFSRAGDGTNVTVWDDEPAEQQLAGMIGEHPFVSAEAQAQYTVPADDIDDPGRSYSTRVWACSALGQDGRCTIYETRPQLCHDFEPASGPLCVHHMGAEAGE